MKLLLPAMHVAILSLVSSYTSDSILEGVEEPMFLNRIELQSVIIHFQTVAPHPKYSVLQSVL